MNSILQNVFGSWFTSLVGGIAGVPQMVEGYQTHNMSKFIVGLGTFLLGLAAKH